MIFGLNIIYLIVVKVIMDEKDQKNRWNSSKYLFLSLTLTFTK